MNLLFAETTTGIAFNLTLSKQQCNALLRSENYNQDLKHIGGFHIKESPVYFCTIGTLKPLVNKGLVFWHQDEKGQACGFGGLTEAGKHVVALLKEAGLTVENTNTVSVLKRLANGRGG